MSAENGNQQAIKENGLPWWGILTVGILVVLSLGGLLYSFLISAP